MDNPLVMQDCKDPESFKWYSHVLSATSLCGAMDCTLRRTVFTSRGSVSISGNINFNSRFIGAEELCESRGGCPGLPVPNSPYGLCGRGATFEEDTFIVSFALFAYTIL